MIDNISTKIIDPIWRWFLSKILDKVLSIFSKRKDNVAEINNSKIIELYEERLKGKDKEVKELRKEKQDLKKDQTSRKERAKKLISSLKRRGISTDNLIGRYDKPLNAIFISYSSQHILQKKKTKEGDYYKDQKFIREELQKYNVKGLGGSDFIIPPTKVPRNINNNEDLQKWFEKKVLKGRFCKVKLLTLIDLKKKTFWKNYLPYKQKHPFHFTIGEVLDIQDLFSEENLNNISLSTIIKDGDLGWLASSSLLDKEIAFLHGKQKAIEKELGNPSLRILAQERMITKISKVLSKYGIEDSNDVAKSIVEEAKFWEEQLKL